MRDHSLWREITATQVVNNVVQGGGSTFVFRLTAETGASASDIARAYSVTREVFQMRVLWEEIEALDNLVDAETQIAMLLAGRKLLERGTRWLLRNRRRPLAIADTVGYFAPGATALYRSLPRLLAPGDAEPLAEGTDELREAGVPEEIAAHVASLGTLFSAFDIVEVASETGLDVEPVAAVHFCVGSKLELHWIRDRIVELPRGDRWGALARAALRDDLYSLHRTLTSEVLQDGVAADEVAERVAAWVDGNPAAERYLATLADVRLGRLYDLTTLPVVVREVRNLIGAP
jgi:glutamate dehydrogenase